MITANHLYKKYDDIEAISNVSITIKKGEVFGLIGTNGAGKSTFLRMACGVLKPDSDILLIDGEPIYENPAMKKNVFYISDEQYYLPNSTPLSMAKFYRDYYPEFDMSRFVALLENFGLKSNRKINTFSKGMKKQLSVLLGICANTRYLFCDETFDGLDPVMRQTVKSLFAGELTNRDFTPVVASHNLRELEDICDHVGIMDHGKMLLERSLADMQGNTVKLQMVGEVPSELNILHESQLGRLRTLVIRGSAEEVEAKVRGVNPTYYDLLPLSLEEIFIYELGGVNYEAKNIVL
jgi:ABC-2 type transport system ATP-binding protein